MPEAEVTTVPCVSIPYSIRYWYSNADHLWVVQVIDEYENQVGEADYAANRHYLPSTLKYMTAEAFVRYEENS